MSISLLKRITSTVLMDHVKAKYHIMETTFTVLQLFDHVTDTTEDYACVIALHLCNKFFDNFQVRLFTKHDIYSLCNIVEKSVTFLCCVFKIVAICFESNHNLH